MFVKERFILNKRIKNIIHNELIPNFGYDGFGEFVFYRTYSRIKEDGLNETWGDVVIRVTEGTFSIRKDWYVKNHIDWDEEYWQSYAHKFAITMFDMRWLPPGRGLFAMGTQFTYERGSMALYNCAALTIGDDIGDDIYWIMDALMCGIGVGFNPLRNNDLKLYKSEEEYTYVIPDSREGWCESVNILIDSYLYNDIKPIFDYSLIRKAGLPIKGFGGISSGPEPLIRLHNQINQFCNRYIKESNNYDSVRLKTDIVNCVASCVVSGSVRRSALIALGSIDDQVFLDLKDYKKYPERAEWGWSSNNSVILEKDSDFEKLGEIAKRVISNGEPGFINKNNLSQARIGRKLGKLRKDKANSCNPCGEIGLEGGFGLGDGGELCNLSETFPTVCNSPEEWYQALEFATFYCSTVSLLPTHSSRTNKIIAKNRRIGLGLVDFIGWKEKYGMNQVIKFMRQGYKIIRAYNKKFNEEAGVPSAIRCTTIKPGGCRLWDSLTTTNEGILTLEELFEDHPEDQIWAKYKKSTQVIQDGIKNKIIRTYNNQLATVYRITTSYGFQLESTMEHEWFVKEKYERGGGINRTGENKWTRNINSWIKTKNLNIGHILDFKPGIYEKYEHAKLIKLNSLSVKMRKHNPIEITQPLEMNPDLAWLLGYLWGDGAMSPTQYRLRFIDANWMNLDKAREIIKTQFNLMDIRIHEASEHKKAFILSISSRLLWHWLIKNNIFKYFDDNLDLIPKIVRQSSHEDILAFFAGLIDSDGCISNNGKENRVVISTINELFADHIQHIALAVGIVFGKARSHSETRKSKNDILMLTTSKHSIKERFDLMLKHSNKMQYLLLHPELPWIHDHGDRNTRTIFGKIKKIEVIGVKPTYDIEVENDPWYYAGGIKSHNSVSKLPGKTPGIGHPSFIYTLRRVRVQRNHPITQILKDANVPYEPDYYSQNTDVFEFPIKQGPGKTANEVSIWEQAWNIITVQREWADNAVSNTILYKPKWVLIEDIKLTDPKIIEKVAPYVGIGKAFNLFDSDWEDYIIPEQYKIERDKSVKIYEYDPRHEENDIEPVLSMIAPLTKSISLLPHSSTGVYPQMPEEGISEKEYLERKKAIKPIDWSQFRGSDGLDIKYCDSDKCII